MATPIQHRIYSFIRDYINLNNYPPSLIEIAKGVGVQSKSYISRSVQALKNEGLIDLEPKGYRRIRLKIPAHSHSIPLLGRIAAGVPIEAINRHEVLNLNELLNLTQSKIFALEVKGNSMIEEGILDGDLVFCESREFAKNGEIIVALVDNQEATLKRIRYEKNDKVTLIPANTSLKPISYEAHRIHIQGVFIGLLRTSKQIHL